METWRVFSCMVYFFNGMVAGLGTHSPASRTEFILKILSKPRVVVKFLEFLEVLAIRLNSSEPPLKGLQ